MTSKAVRNIAPAKRASNAPKQLSVIIPAAGMGKRMKYVGAKSLIELSSGITVLERQLQLIRQTYPHAEVIVSIGFEYTKFLRKFKQRYDVRFTYNPMHETTNVVMSLAVAMCAASSENLLIIYGDLVFNEAAITGIVGSNSKALIDVSAKHRQEEVGVVVVDNVCTSFAYEIEPKWGQIVYLTDKEAHLFERAVFNDEHAKWYGYEALNYVLEHGGKIEAFHPPNLILHELDTTKDMERLTL